MVKKLFFLVFVLFSELLQAQSCYLQGDDATGFDVKEHLPDLEQAACILKNKFPTAFKDKFKVASYGLPTISYQAEGAAEFYDTYYSDKTAKSADFYLLFIRAPAGNYPNSKYSVKVKLPTTGVFSCINDDKISQINLKMENATKLAIAKVSKSPLDYYKVEIEVMKSFALLIEQISQGNCDILTKDEVFTFLDEKGFSPVPCKIKGVNTETSNPLGTFAVNVSDKANLKVERIDVPNQDIAFKYLAEYAINLYILEGKSSKGFITNAINQFPAVESEFGTKNANVWWHLWDNPKANEDDYFFIRRNDEVKSTYAKPVANCNPDWEQSPCYDFDTDDKKSGIFFVFGTQQSQSWCLDYNTTCKAAQIDGCNTTFQPNFITNIDYLSETLSSNKHKKWTLNKCFDWSQHNHLTNNVEDRTTAATLLVEYVKNNLPVNEKNDKSIPITLIGYSHGGNVAIQAVPMLYQALGKKINLITIATPASNFTIKPKIKFSTKDNSPLSGFEDHLRYIENPIHSSVSNYLNVHYHFWMENDFTAGAASWVLEGSHKEYFNSKTTSFNLTNQKCSDAIWNNSSWFSKSKYDRHGFPYFLPCINELVQDNQINRQ